MYADARTQQFLNQELLAVRRLKSIQLLAKKGQYYTHAYKLYKNITALF